MSLSRVDQADVLLMDNKSPKPVTYYVTDYIEGDECVLFHCDTYNAAMHKCAAEMIRRPDAKLAIWDSKGNIVTLKIRSAS
jgi:hypothetical protein